MKSEVRWKWKWGWSGVSEHETIGIKVFQCLKSLTQLMKLQADGHSSTDTAPALAFGKAVLMQMDCVRAHLQDCTMRL